MLNIEKEKLNFSSNYEEEVIQVVFDKDIIVPDTKTDIDDIIEVSSQVHIKKSNVEGNKINYEGNIEYDVIYMGTDDDKIPQSIVGELDINDSVNIQNIENKEHRMYAQVEYMQYTVINSRKMNVKVVVNLKVKTEKKVESEVIKFKDLSNVQVKNKQLLVDNIINTVKEKFIIKEELMIPTTKPAVKNVLKCDMTLRNMEVKPYEEKLNIKGNVSIKMLYTSQENAMEQIEFEVSLNELVENCESVYDVLIDDHYDIEDKYIEIICNEDGEEKIIKLEIIVSTNIDIINIDEKEIVSDVYSLDRNINIEREILKYDKIAMKNKNKYMVKEVVKMDEEEAILQIYNVDGKIRIEHLEIVDDKVEVAGSVDCEILYVVADDKNPIKTQKSQINFTQIIDVLDVNSDMKINMEASIEHMAFTMMAKNEIELKVNLLLYITAIEKKEEYVIKNIEELEEINKENNPSMVIYITKENDDLWTVAKKYNTTMEDVKKINDLKDEKVFNKGEKLVILK